MNSTLIAVEGPLKGTLLVLDRPEVFVGRERSNTLSIDDASVSRRHFSIVRQGEKFTLRDLSSHNGTYLNGKAVREAVLNVGDRIQVGKTVLLFAPADE